jgi:hypothetical protein
MISINGLGRGIEPGRCDAAQGMYKFNGPRTQHCPYEDGDGLSREKTEAKRGALIWLA